MTRLLLLLALSVPAVAAQQGVPPSAASPYLDAARAEIAPLFPDNFHLALAGSSTQADLDAVIARAAALPGRGVIYLSAPTAAGKSTLAVGIAKALGPRLKTFPMDEYFKDVPDMPTGVEGTPDFDRPDSLKLADAAQDLRRLFDHGQVELPAYDFASGTGRPNGGKILTLGPNDVLLIDSIYAAHTDVRAALAGPSLSVFLQAPAVVRLKRRLKRDREERGVPVALNLSLWGNILYDEEHYILPLARQAAAALSLVAKEELEALPRDYARILAEEWERLGGIDRGIGGALKRRIAQSLAADGRP